MSTPYFHPLQTTVDWQHILRVALRNGGDWADVFWESSLSTQLSLEDKRPSNLTQGLDEGIGIRVLFEGRSVYVFGNDLTPEAFQELARQASQGVEAVKKQLPWTPQLLHRDFPTRVRPADAASIKDKFDLLQSFDAECWKSPLVQQARSTLSDIRRRSFVVRSDGRASVDDKSYLSIMGQLTGEADAALGGGKRSSHGRWGGFRGLEYFDEHTPAKMAAELQHRLAVALRSLPAPSGSMTVILSPESGGTMVHEAVGHGLEADLAEEGLSVYSGKLEQQVASPKVSVVDDGEIPGLYGTHGVDDEGNPTGRTLLIDKGILKSYMYDQRMALKSGHAPTGNGRRQTYRHMPMVRMTNTYIAEGDDDNDAIVRDTARGLYVAKMGGGQVETVSGNFVFYVAEAYLVRNGKLAEPVRGATLSGNGPQVLREVDRVGKGLQFDIGFCGKNGQTAPVTDAQPMMRIPRLTVGGLRPLSDYFSE